MAVLSYVRDESDARSGEGSIGLSGTDRRVAPRRTVEVLREPDSERGRYRTLLTMAKGETLSPVSVPGVTISLSDLFA
jgi:hypothetical protein